MKCKLGRKLLSFLLALALVLGLLPGMSMKAYAAGEDITSNITIMVSDSCQDMDRTVDNYTKDEYTVKEGVVVTFQCSKWWSDTATIYLNGTAVATWAGSDYRSTYVWTAKKNAKLNWAGYGQGSANIYLTETSHDHSFTYTGSGDTITATCNAEGCDLTDNKTTLTITAPTLTTYGLNGQVISETDGRGVTTTYTYDALGRVTQRKREGAADKWGNKETSTTTCTYGTSGNSKGRVTEKSLGYNKVTYEYDEYGRVTAEIRPNTYCHCGQRHELRRSYEYNSLGQVTSVTYPALHSQNGLTVEYRYDKYGYKKSESYNYKTLSMTSTFHIRLEVHCT